MTEFSIIIFHTHYKLDVDKIATTLLLPIVTGRAILKSLKICIFFLSLFYCLNCCIIILVNITNKTKPPIFNTHPFHSNCDLVT